MRASVKTALNLLSETVRISNSTMNIDERLDRILAEIHSSLMPRAVALYVFDAEKENLHIKSSRGGAFKTSLAVADSPLESCIKNGRYHIFDGDPESRKLLADVSGEPSVGGGGIFPIIDDRFSYGALVLTFDEKDMIDEDDLALLDPITHEIAGTIRNAQLYSRTKMMAEELTELNMEKELMVRELSNLFELNKAVMTTIDLDRLLHIILTAVTTGDGFGFNRAMLFLYNDKTGYIQGMMAVGPDTAEDAWHFWSEINEKKKTLHDILEEEELTEPRSRLNEMVKGIRVSIGEESILGLTVKEKRAFNITDARNDPRVNRELLSKLNCQAFATSPLMASGRVMGVILVDNVFNNRPITDDDIRLLTIFSNQAGMAIENSILYRNLKDAHRDLKEAQGKLLHSEKLVALGEMAAGVAHEIRNPLVSIGGFARRLSRRVGDSEDNMYVDIICKEVERLENILNDILIFSREEAAELEPLDINRVIEDTLQFFLSDFENCDIEVNKELQTGLDMIEGNYHQLKQVFINLFSNARHSMESGGSLTIRSSQSDLEGERRNTIEISDTGGGIPYNIINNIFNPFFTTKDDGTGLGLAITHKIVTSYGGDIEVINNENGGATFIITIPVLIKKC